MIKPAVNILSSNAICARASENQQSAYAKTKSQITAKLISAFVFATQIVQFLYFLNPKFQASSHLLGLYRLVCHRPDCWFPHAKALLFISRYVLQYQDSKIRINHHVMTKPALGTCKKRGAD